MSDGGDPIMDAPPQGDAQTVKVYMDARNRSAQGSIIWVLVLAAFGAGLGGWMGGSMVSAAIGAALMVAFFFFTRSRAAQLKARRDVAAEQAAHAVRASMKERQISEAQARGDFDRFGRDA